MQARPNVLRWQENQTGIRLYQDIDHVLQQPRADRVRRLLVQNKCTGTFPYFSLRHFKGSHRELRVKTLDSTIARELYIIIKQDEMLVRGKSRKAETGKLRGEIGKAEMGASSGLGVEEGMRDES